MYNLFTSVIGDEGKNVIIRKRIGHGEFLTLTTIPNVIKARVMKIVIEIANGWFSFSLSLFFLLIPI